MVEDTPNSQETAEATLPEPTESMSGPNKLGERDLNPKGANPKRLSTRAGVIFLGAGIGLVVLLLAGIMSRSQKIQQQTNSPKIGAVDPATNAADALTTDLWKRKQIEDSKRKDEGAAGAGFGNEGGAGAADTPIGSSVPPLKLTHIGGARASRGGGRVPDLNESGSLTEPGAGRAYGAQVGRKSAEELVREREYKEYLAATAAPTAISERNSGGSGGGSGALGALLGGEASNPVVQALLARAKSLRQAQASGNDSSLPIASGASQNSDPNMQDRKMAFLKESGPEDVYLHSTREAQLSPYEVKAGWDIPAALEQGINTDIPGQIRALVRENVYDTATGNYLLIPQGSRLIGSYDSHIAYGQTRVQVQWTRLIYPDGSSISLGGMIGQDTQGKAGFHHKTNNHYVRLASMALLTSAFAAGIGIASNQGESSSPYGLSNGQIASQAVGQQMGEMGMEITRRNMNIQPTITIPIGYRFNVRVNKDIVFEGPYVPE